MPVRADDTGLLIEEIFKCARQILEYMPSISNLDGFWRPTRYSFLISSGLESLPRVNRPGSVRIGYELYSWVVGTPGTEQNREWCGRARQSHHRRKKYSRWPANWGQGSGCSFLSLIPSKRSFHQTLGRTVRAKYAPQSREQLPVVTSDGSIPTLIIDDFPLLTLLLYGNPELPVEIVVRMTANPIKYLDFI